MLFLLIVSCNFKQQRDPSVVHQINKDEADLTGDVPHEGPERQEHSFKVHENDIGTILLERDLTNGSGCKAGHTL